ncbi:hypothetical protein ARHIZOSPH14_14740 [Agromyces rhizosphaerae]|uniref:DUF3566 domain-containing protein n=1 Tax=Agromyces rhizosphaerae TaxID=88374 RepID=A0A9W6CXV0_9MICO|nr:DUF3566 domain-containing protein [Agromyces rhizosphaerae]GLI27232.1 hypothetical protein ARHIZOSPH14_14740 [Agromyces rhizosphaerae]
MSSVADKLAKKSSRRTPAKQVRLRLVYIDFWSALKLSFLVAVCIAVINIVATFLVWTVLNSTDIFTMVNDLVQDIAGTAGDLTAFLSLGNIMGFAIIVSLLNLVVTTALGAIVAVLYNLSVKVTGGILVGFTNN